MDNNQNVIEENKNVNNNQNVSSEKTKKNRTGLTIVIIVMIILVLFIGYACYQKFFSKDENSNTNEITESNGLFYDYGNGVKIYGDGYLIRLKSDNKINAYDYYKEYLSFKDQLSTTVYFDMTYNSTFSVNGKKIDMVYKRDTDIKNFSFDIDYNVKSIYALSDGANFNMFDVFMLDTENNLHKFSFNLINEKPNNKKDEIIIKNVSNFVAIDDVYYTSGEDQLILIYKDTNDKIYYYTSYGYTYENNDETYNRVIIYGTSSLGDKTESKYNSIYSFNFVLANTEATKIRTKDGDIDEKYSYITYNDKEINVKYAYLDEDYLCLVIDDNKIIKLYKDEALVEEYTDVTFYKEMAKIIFGENMYTMIFDESNIYPGRFVPDYFGLFSNTK